MKLNLDNNIRTYRKKLNWNQEQLAERLGVSFQSVSRWENGTTVPDIELIVAMARIFGCTVDELLGCGEPTKKLTQEELRQMLWDSLQKQDPAEMAELLRTMRHDYLKEFVELEYLLGMIRPDTPLYENEEVMQEYRLGVAAALENNEFRWCHPSLIHHLVQKETVSNLSDSIRKHHIYYHWDMTETGLLSSWAQHHNDHDLLRRLIQESGVRHLYELIHEPVWFLEDGHVNPDDPWDCERRTGEGNPAAQKEISRRKLDFLHLHSGIETDESHPVSGDGKMDFWVGLYLEIGMRYAAQLAACGECDEALAALEDCAGLIEQLLHFPDGLEKFMNGYRFDKCPELPVRDPDFCLVQAVRAPVCFLVNNERRNYPAAINIGIGGSYPGSKFPQFHFSYHVQLNIEDMLTSVWKPSDSYYSSWFNPIRRRPRYKAVLERIRTAIPWYKSDCPCHTTVPEE